MPLIKRLNAFWRGEVLGGPGLFRLYRFSAVFIKIILQKLLDKCNRFLLLLTTMKQIAIKIDRELYEALRAVKKHTGATVSWQANTAIRLYLNETTDWRKHAKSQPSVPAKP